MGDDTMTEAEKAMMEVKKKHNVEESEKMKEYEAMRGEQRQKEEQELKELKEKQAQRKEIREQESREMNERARAEEERRRQEEEERKQRMEEEKRKRDERKKKATGIPGFTGAPTIIIKKKEGVPEPKGKLIGPSREEIEAKKQEHLNSVCKPINMDTFGMDGLIKKVKELHQRICKLEADKYDLEKRHERQEYDLKELHERERQMARNKALEKGLDPEEAANSPHPPKIKVVTKYDRQIDRRGFKDRKLVFDGVKNSYPHFPNCMPPEQEMKKVIKGYETEEPAEAEAAPAKPAHGGGHGKHHAEEPEEAAAEEEAEEEEEEE